MQFRDIILNYFLEIVCLRSDLGLVFRATSFLFMKHLFIILLLLIYSTVTIAQKPAKKPSPTPSIPPVVKLDENQEFQNARAQTNLNDKVVALQKFITDFPKSQSKMLSQELIVSTRAQLGEQKLSMGDNQNGIELFRIAVIEAPTPVSNKLFEEILVQLPTNLYFRDQRVAANDIARLIEEKISGNASQLLGLAAFFLGTENGTEAKRLAEMAIAFEPSSAAAFQTLGFANRLNFDLEGSATAYEKALELNPDSIVSKRSLAEMKRATGKSDEAVRLFREVLQADPADSSAKNGLILSLFNDGKQNEAESAMAAAFEENPNNFFLLVCAAYWYAAHEQGAKAIELANKAIEIEPRYSWAYIALGRGLIQQKRPWEAERTLMIARQYGNFPTLNYELASARMASGFFREAADELKKSFNVKDGVISVYLGGRILKQGKSFTDTLSFERLASIFEPVAADDPVTARQLKSLLRFSESLSASELNETEISEAADEFIDGEDKMKIHRALFAANRLLESRVVPQKAMQVTQSAIAGVDTSLNVVSPVAAVMADMLYETRTIASLRNELLIVPNVPRQTLTRILRGRIEELTGWALLQQEKPEEAVARFNRAISILPEKSAWWRSSKWRLGDALESAGNSTEALKAYIESYDTDAPDLAKRLLIELVYKKVNGSIDGLDRFIGAKPVVARFPTVPGEIQNESSTVGSEIETDPAKNPGELVDPKTDSLVKTDAATEAVPESEPSVKILKIPENVPTVSSTPVGTEIVPVSSNEKTDEPDKSGDKKETPPATNTAAPLFDPIVIIVPKNGIDGKKIEGEATLTKNAAPENIVVKEPAGIKADPVKTTGQAEDESNDSGANEKQKTGSEPDQNEKELPKTTEPEKSDSTITSRPRIFDDAKAETKDPASQCELKFDQKSISLLNDGGSLGMFVGFEGVGGDPTKIRAISNSPNDVDVEIQPDIGVLSEKAFFIFKSISTKTGIFTISFDSNCGKKDISVTVR